MSMFVIFLALALFPLPLRAQTPQPPLYEGMEAELPLDFMERNAFVPYDNFRASPRAPIAAAILFDGAAPSDLGLVFLERFMARLPDGLPIRSSRDAQGREVWLYPEGALIAHAVLLKSVDPLESDVFELRIVRKMPGVRWAFGIYRPEGGVLRLQTYQGMRDDEFTVNTPQRGRVRVTLKHIPLGSCRNCHARTTAAPYQYGSPEAVGPCEFTPANPRVRREWAPRYGGRHGADPIVNQWGSIR